MDVIGQLEHQRTAERCERLRQVLAARTRHVTLILEDVYRPQNSSAVLRNCDGFGIQDVYVVANRNPFQPDGRITRGAEKWLTVHEFRNAEAEALPFRPSEPLTAAARDNLERCLRTVRSRGYRIAAACPATTSPLCLEDLPLDQPLAVMIGTERSGLSAEAAQAADLQFSIPMFGLSKSFNLSVFSALCLHSLLTRLRRSGSLPPLPEADQQELYRQWLEK